MLRKKISRAAKPLVFTLLLALGQTANCLAEAGDYYPVTQCKPELQFFFTQGMEARESGDLTAAIEAFQTVLSNQPMLHRARLEMAVAYYKDQNFQEAYQQAQQVLDDPKTPPNVRVTILAFLAQVKSDAEKACKVEHSWRFPVSVSYLYDTNTNAGPDADTIGHSNLNAISEGKADSGTVISAGINHTLQTTRRLNMGQQEAVLLWQSGLNLYQRNYFNEHADDLNVYSLYTGPTLISRAHWRANLTGQVDYIEYGDKELAYFAYLLPSLTLHVTDALEVTIDGTANLREYTRDQEQGRDSAYLAGRLSAGQTFGKDRFGVQAGVQYFNENAKANIYSNEGLEFFLGGNWRIFDKCNLFAMVSRRDANYDGDAPYTSFVNPADNIVREDDEERYTAGLNYTFINAGWLTDWKMEAKLVHTKLDSNISPFDYDRTQSFLTLSRIFQ
jgi:tetratricopeptide (TPR) repeat protein